MIERLAYSCRRDQHGGLCGDPRDCSRERGGGLSSESRITSTKVTRPILTIAKSGPERQYLGRRIQYTITVTNKGSALARDTVIEDTIPSGVKDVQVSEGGKIAGSKVVWDVGTLTVSSSRKVTVSYLPSEAGTFSNTAGASAYCADAVTAWARTSVEGIAAILLEVIDVSDPIELGDSETYQITVTNQGSAPDTNIVINCSPASWRDARPIVDRGSQFLLP